MAKQSYTNPGLPSNLYAGAAVRIDTRPFANMLYQEQKYQEAKRQKESEDLDNEMKSNVASIRDADVPDYVNAYQNYANITKSIMNDAKLKRNPQAYAAAQLQRGQAYAAAQGLANQSKSLRSNFEQMDRDYSAHGDKYSDNYTSRRSAANKLPISKLQGVDLGEKDEKGNPLLLDLTNPDTYQDQHTYYDFGTAVNKAYGTPKYTGYSTQTPLDKKGIDLMQTDYKYGARPSEMVNTLLGNFSGSKEAAKASRQFGAEITPKMWDDMVTAYNNVPAEKLKQIGLDKPDDLSTLHFPGNDSEKAAHYLVMQHFVNSKVETDAPKRITNTANKMAAEQAFQREQTNTKFQNDLKVKAAKEGGQVSGNDIIDTLYQDSLSNPNVIKYQPKGGGEEKWRIANVDPALKEALAFKDEKTGHIIYPDDVTFSPDGKYVRPLVYQTYGDENKEKKGQIIVSPTGKKVIVEANSQPVLTDVLRARMGKTLFGVKGAAAIMKGQGNAPKPTQKYSLGGKTYAHKDLNNMGYSDDEINQAIKAGIIK